MPKVALFNVSGSQVGEVELNDAVFGIEPNTHVLHEAVVMQRASLRFGTHKVKGRSEVRGGGRKPWKQRNRTCPSRFDPFATMGWWRYCIWTDSTQLFLQTAEESSSSGDQIGFVC